MDICNTILNRKYFEKLKPKQPSYYYTKLLPDLFNNKNIIHYCRKNRNKDDEKRFLK